MDSTIGFIGGGNMARALIGGLIQGGFSPAHIYVCEPAPEQQQRLNRYGGIHVGTNANDVIQASNCVLLAVKPQVLHEALQPLKTALKKHQPLLISIVAGIRQQTIQRWLEHEHAIVRCMPNTPALIQAGATALYANPAVSDAQKNLAESILRSAGLTIWVENETLLDAVTALSGSGPAYVFLVIEAMQAAGVKLGLDEHQARLLSLQTVFGAAKMALEDPEPVAQLRQQVTSKGGTTEKAIATFQQANFMDLFLDAMTAARDRAEELATQLDQQ